MPKSLFVQWRVRKPHKSITKFKCVNVNYHTPVNEESNQQIPDFLIKNNELVLPQKVYDTQQYPNLKQTLVKIVGKDGSNIFIPLSKFAISTSEL